MFYYPRNQLNVRSEIRGVDREDIYEIPLGMGIWKMKEAMVAAGLREPTFEPDGFFRAIFHRSPEFALKEGPPALEKMSEEMVVKLVDKLAEGLVEGLAENQKSLLQLIIRKPRISKKAMAETIGISTTAVDNNLSKLKKVGLLRRIGPDKGGHWEVIRKNER
ncbi:winged helix-turn-helix transcriptional regulator [Candidatus Methylomirabilis sp.]|uniref:winged helix-turn-helix transcriptional regulator n=1 Tax=Candidatus Methylomirabilis sp. TaxID=2032687 RepID=UPI00307631E8